MLTIPGVGLLTATALIAAIGAISVFKNGRELGAWFGLLPRPYSTGDKDAAKTSPTSHWPTRMPGSLGP
ncbi:MAG: transposase [Gammaproteobacteria bacterium]